MLPYHPRCIFNTSVSEALKYKWQPIHLAEKELSEPTLSCPFGASIHSFAAREKAIEKGASYLLFGPIFSPLSKDGQAVGLKRLQNMCMNSRLPVLAIGGITPDNTPQVLQNGASGVASAGWMMQTQNRQKEIERFLTHLL